MEASSDGCRIEWKSSLSVGIFGFSVLLDRCDSLVIVDLVLFFFIWGGGTLRYLKLCLIWIKYIPTKKFVLPNLNSILYLGSNRVESSWENLAGVKNKVKIPPQLFRFSTKYFSFRMTPKLLHFVRHISVKSLYAAIK